VSRVAAWGASGAAATLAYASLVERNAFTVRRFRLPVLPSGAPDLRVLHVTDMHLVPRQQRKVRWVRALADLRPDLVVNTGDNLAHADAVGPALAAMEAFRGIPSVFVLGSNDYFAPTFKNPVRYLTKSVREPTTARLPTGDLVRGLVDRGWVDLDNARARVRVGGLDLEFVGVDDPHIQLDRYAAVAGPADPAADLTVGVLHAPYTRVLDAMAGDGAGLIIAGHTHGGQLALPWFGALVTNSDLDRRRAKGVTRWWPGARGVPASRAPHSAAWMHVSAGLGTSPYAPARFACRPEASLLTLTAAGQP
jgi:predicted MPP superfamily phosphohydrolase